MIPNSHENLSPKILILGAFYDTGNMGVDALLSGTIASILKTKPNALIKALDYGHKPRSHKIPNENKETKIELINLRFSYKLHLHNNIFRLLFVAILYKAFNFNSFHRFLVKAHPHLGEIASSHICVSLAGGDSFSDIYGMRRLWYVSLPQIVAILLDRPLVLLPQTLGPFKSNTAKRIAKFIMKHAKSVFSRDQESMTHAHELLGANVHNLYFSRDMAFALEPMPPEAEDLNWLNDKSRPSIGLNVSGLLQMGGYSKDNMFGLSLDYPSLIESIILYFTRDQNANLVLVTHVTGAPNGMESDATACQILYDEFKTKCDGRLYLAKPSYNHREIKYIIGKCDFFLGARMHACIAALSQSVPAVGMAYSRKFKGVFESLEVPELVVDLRKANNAEALEQIEQLYASREHLQNTLVTTSSIAKKDAYNIFERIFSDLECETVPLKMAVC